MLKDLRDRIQLDRPLAYALMTRIWQAVSGPVTILLLIRSLDLSEQLNLAIEAGFGDRESFMGSLTYRF